MTRNAPIKNRLTIKKIQKALKKEKHPRNLLLFLLAINTGLNLTTLLKLNIKDVKNKEAIKLKQNIIYYFPDEIKKLINETTKDRNLDEPLFVSIFNRRMDRFAVHYIFNELCSKFSLDDFSISSLRKTFGYHYYLKYKDLLFLQWYFGHKTPEETMKYIDIEENLCERFRQGIRL